MLYNNISSNKNVEKYILDLHRYALSLTRHPETAEDLVQDSLEKGLSHMDQFLKGTNLRAWLFTIMRNKYFDDRRKLSRRGREFPIEEWYPELHRPPVQEARIHISNIKHKIDKLRPCDQKILKLNVIYGLTYEEIAARCNIAVGTVKSRISRARRNMAA